MWAESYVRALLVELEGAKSVGNKEHAAAIVAELKAHGHQFENDVETAVQPDVTEKR